MSMDAPVRPNPGGVYHTRGVGDDGAKLSCIVLLRHTSGEKRFVQWLGLGPVGGEEEKLGVGKDRLWSNRLEVWTNGRVRV